MTDSGHYISLPKDDAKDSQGNPAVSTTTFYKGIPPVKEMQKRIEAVIRQNPWLSGEYRKNPTTKVFPALWTPNEPDFSNHFELINDPDINIGISFSKLERRLKPLLVNKGKPGRAKAPEPLFKVIVIQGKDDNFSVTVSLCHTLADGHTYYNIFSMLGLGVEIKRMVVERIDAREEILDKMGRERIEWFMSPQAMIPFVAKMLFNNHKPIYRYINMDWLAEQKAEYQPTAEVPFVSSNDIISSMLMNELGMDSCLMAVDPRGRIPTLGKEHAGSYEGPLVFMRNEFSTPADIRLSVKGKKPSTWTTVPGLFKSLGMNMGVISNWAGWDTEMRMEGCEQLLHIPLFAKPLMATMVVVWRPAKDQIAVLMNANPKIQKTIEAHPAIGASVVED
jgi:hypothetical protein